MKPANFPERKRQRQLGALQRLLKVRSADRHWKEAEIAALYAATSGSKRFVMTKKPRAGSASFARA